MKRKTRLHRCCCAAALALLAAGMRRRRPTHRRRPTAATAATTSSRSASSRSSRSTSTTPWSTPPRSGTRTSPDVEVVFAQGKSGTDDEGEIAAIESMVTQGVKAIAITPTSPNVQDALQKAVDAGHQGRPRRQRHPRLGRQDLGRRHRQPGRRRARRRVAGGEAARRATSRRPPGRARQPVARRPGRRACSRRLGDAAEVVADAADRLRPDQGPRRGPGHPHRATRTSTAIYGACGPPITRRARGDQGGRARPG